MSFALCVTAVSIFTECIAVPGSASYVYISPYRFVAIKVQNQVAAGLCGTPWTCCHRGTTTTIT